MVGNFSRQCLNSRWVGSIPKCVEELNFGIISAINLADKNNHSLKYEDGWVNRDPVAAYYVDYKRDKCLRSTTMSRPHSWKLHLAKEKRHISYIEVVIKDTGNRFDNLDASKIIKYARVNELRECVASVVDTTDATKRLALNCLMEFDGDSNWEAWERDKTQVIDIQFDVNDISICEIRLYTNSFMPFHRCGSADIVMYSTMEFIKSGNKYSGNSYYKYQCDEGFQLEGSDDVRCGLNNNWLDPFPVCKPKAMCPYPPDMNGALSVGIKTEHLYSYDGNVSALAGSVIYYQCVGDNGNHSIMIGDSVRLCGINGNWSGVSPVCIHDSELNSDHFNDIKQSDQNYKHMTTIEMFANLTKIANQTALACGIPAMPLFAKPTTAKRYRMFGGQADLRRWYDNGTVLTYQCESAYRWVSGDVDQRTCINGKWIGNVGKCAVNWGNKVKLDVIYVYDLDNKGQWTNQHLVMSTNSTSAWDEHFAYRRDPDKGECATFTVDSKHRWSLRLNETTFITYFVVMLHPGGFFGAKRKISDPKILAKSPVTASVERTDCVLTSVWDYTHSKIGTFFFFTCDMKEPKPQTYRCVRWP
ncbi:uncharacterized protein LOC128958227 [Oppia nitens]|uniref:uncharacterized protein LOC128958227 n=1 Tax=Oppia nitens TaxID=1686743 RepID=UPI0023DCA8C8|nr:uncharacterized protein LOC128958227 [Oppia nitens]